MEPAHNAHGPLGASRVRQLHTAAGRVGKALPVFPGGRGPAVMSHPCATAPKQHPKHQKPPHQTPGTGKRASVVVVWAAA